jgi:hypothetical protein
MEGYKLSNKYNKTNKELFVENIFEEIMDNCSNKNVTSLCKKLSKKLSFKSGKDAEYLCHLTYWLYILGKIDLVKKCIAITHNVKFDKKDNIVWIFIRFMWGIEIKILREDGKKIEADELVKTIDQHLLTPSLGETPERMWEKENKRRDRFSLGIESQMDVSNQKNIEDSLLAGDEKLANKDRFVALFSLIGRTEIGLCKNLNNNKERIANIWPSAIPNAKKYNALGGKSELPKDDLVEWMDIFKLPYVERLTPSATAAVLNRKPSSITRETAKDMDNGMYNPVIAEAGSPEKPAPAP